MDTTANIDATKTVVTNFFVHWLKELDIKCYPDEIHILPTNNTVDIYRHSEKMLKHLPQKKHYTLLRRRCSTASCQSSSPDIATEELSILPQQQTEHIKISQIE